jgi:hypothetical protein
MANEPKQSVLWHQSGVNKKGEAFVQLFHNDDIICQLTPEQARDHAKNILEAAEASEQDAFMLHFFTTQVGADLQHALQIIVQFRKWRESQGKKGPASDRNEFVQTEKHEKPSSEMS